MEYSRKLFKFKKAIDDRKLEEFGIREKPMWNPEEILIIKEDELKKSISEDLTRQMHLGVDKKLIKGN